MNNRVQLTLFADVMKGVGKGTHQSRRFIGYLKFPVASTNGRGPNTIFCQSLGATSQQQLPVELKAYYEKLGRKFTTFEYEQSLANNVHDQDTMPISFNFDAAVEDVVTLIDRFYQTHGPQNLLGVNLGATIALRAAIARPEKLKGLGLIAPVLGISVSYMDNISPGSSHQLAQGFVQQYPCNQMDVHAHNHPHYICHEALMNLIYKCPMNTEQSSMLPLHVPVNVVHGTNDKIVSYRNSVAFANKLQKGQCKLVLANQQSHFFHELTPEIKQVVDELVADKDVVQEKESDKTHVLSMEHYSTHVDKMHELSAHA